MSSSSAPHSFGLLRSLLWPVYRHEVRKFLPMVLILFCICFNYSILRNLKDTIVCTAPHSGAEIIPFLKVWMILPAAVLGMVIYTRLSYWFSQERVFHLMVGGFLIYFLIFGFVIYPHVDLLHPQASADWLESVLPKGLRGMVAMYRNWTFTMFYVMCELWGCVVLNVLFWSFANEITKLEEAKRCYALFLIGSNLGTVLAGMISVGMGELVHAGGGDPMQAWSQLLTTLLTAVLGSGVLVMLLFRWLNHHVKVDRAVKQTLTPKKKKKRSFKESIHHLRTSRYLLAIAVIVIGYNLMINMIEVIWKDQLRTYCPDPVDFNNYINWVITAVGAISTVFAIAMGWMIRRWGWEVTAMSTPVIMAATGIGFFFFTLFQDSAGAWVAAMFGATPLGLAVFFGGMQNSLSKAAKYSLLDATKEMAFIPLDHDSKLKGKAAIDGVGSRVGKSGGSLLHQGLLVIFSSLSASAPYVAGFLGIIVAGWVAAVRSLGRKFREIEAQEALDVSQAVAEEHAPAEPAVGDEPVAVH